MTAPRCYCIHLFTDHRQGARGCGFNRDGSERAVCPGCGIDLFKAPRHDATHQTVR